MRRYQVTTATIVTNPKKHNSNHLSVHQWIRCAISRFTTTNLSYRFPIFETSATALCGTTGMFMYKLETRSKYHDFDILSFRIRMANLGYPVLLFSWLWLSYIYKYTWYDIVKSIMCIYIYIYIYICIWVNYNISLASTKAIWNLEMISLTNHHSSEVAVRSL